MYKGKSESRVEPPCINIPFATPSKSPRKGFTVKFTDHVQSKSNFLNPSVLSPRELKLRNESKPKPQKESEILEALQKIKEYVLDQQRLREKRAKPILKKMQMPIFEEEKSFQQLYELFTNSENFDENESQRDLKKSLEKKRRENEAQNLRALDLLKIEQQIEKDLLLVKNENHSERKERDVTDSIEYQEQHPSKQDLFEKQQRLLQELFQVQNQINERKTNFVSSD